MDLITVLSEGPIKNLPEDIVTLLMESWNQRSKVSIVVMAHVSKFYYKFSRQCLAPTGKCRLLSCFEIATEGSLEILKWAEPLQ